MSRHRAVLQSSFAVHRGAQRSLDMSVFVGLLPKSSTCSTIHLVENRPRFITCGGGHDSSLMGR